MTDESNNRPAAVPGQLRVGVEDTITFSRGRPVQSDPKLVERAATLAGLAERPAMRPDQARSMRGVRDRH
jgi:3-keto-5-aminohexanoate cleavage enzyme